MTEPVTKLKISDGVATITLNRPGLHNALNAELTQKLLDTLRELKENSAVRVVVFTANGSSFCAGADLQWMIAHPTRQTIDSVGLQLAELMNTLNHFSKPTLALVQGAVYGGGIGLVACSDITLASRNAHFCFSEVRLGLIPAIISPYVVNLIGTRAARRYLLTAEHLTAEQAFNIGLVHEVLAEDELPEYANKLIQKLIAAGPHALARTKQLINTVAHSKPDSNMMATTATWLDKVIETAEAKEGISAFFEKRPPAWFNTNKGQHAPKKN